MKTSRSNPNAQRILINQLDYELDLNKFNENYSILRFCPQNSDHHLSAYETVKDLPTGMVKSMHRHREKANGKYGNWYYLLTIPAYLDEVSNQLIETSGDKIFLQRYEIPQDRAGELLVLNLLLNSLNLHGDHQQSNICKSRLTLLRSDNFGVSCTGKEIVTMEINITDEGCLHAHSVTYKEYHPEKNKKRKSNDPTHSICYYYVDGLKMRLSRTAPDNWKKLYENGTLKIYVPGSLKKNKKHIIPQFCMGMNSLDCNKSAILYCLKDLLKDSYPDIIRHLDFSVVRTQRETEDYEKRAQSLVTELLKGCTVQVIDPINNEESQAVQIEVERVLSTFKATPENSKNVQSENLFAVVHHGQADCTLRLTTEKPDEYTTPDSYFSREFPELDGSGNCIQHLSIAQDYLKESFQKPAFGRILKELAIKRMISTRRIPEALYRHYGGWSFAIARKVSDYEYMGMTLHIRPDGKLLPGRLNQFWDVPKGTPRQQSNLLSATHAKSIQLATLPSSSPVQEQYYAVSTGYNSYHIYYSDCQSLPEYNTLKNYYNLMEERPHWTSDELIEIIGGYDCLDIDNRILDHINERKEYHVEAVRSLSRWLVDKKSVKNGYSSPQLAEALSALVDNQPLYNHIKRRENVDHYFGGLVDIHHWKGDDQSLRYVSTESGTELNNVLAIAYNGLPHVRIVLPIHLSRPEKIGQDFEILLEGLKYGFGKAHHGSVLPLPFKIIEEFCELYSLKNYGLHWANMTPKAYKEWNETKALDFFGADSIEI